MDKRCTSPCFSLFVVVALVTHIAELVFSALLAYTLYRDVTHRDVFFSLTAGVIILPLVLVQLVSAIFLLRRRGDAMKGGEAARMAVLHVLQLAFLWRHLALLKKPFLFLHKNELRELFVLRLTFTFAGGFPLLLIQTYLLLTQAALSWPWAVYASLVASALSVTWSMASLQDMPGQADDDLTLTLWSWPASLFCWLWRVGEMVARTLCLALFATLHHQWVLLVLGLHWLVMLLCLSLPQSATSASAAGSSSAHRAAVCLITSYSYVWCYVSLSKVRTAVWYTLYYVIMFLENCTLSIVWLTKTEEETFTSRYLLVIISTLAFLVSMACLLVFYKHFHLLPLPDASLTTTTAATTTTTHSGVSKEGGPGPCTCVLGSKPPQHRHPYIAPSEWSGQYRSALNAGQYYKHSMHDSLLDSSASERTSVLPHRCPHHHHLKTAAAAAAGGRHHQDDGEIPVSARERCGGCSCACAWRGEGDGVSVVSCQTSRSAHSCPHHRRSGLKTTSRSDITDSTSVLTLASGASHNLGYEGSDDTQSNTVPAWLPSGESLIAKHLMVSELCCPGGSAPEDSDKEWALRQEKSMERYRCLLKQEAERWGTEGYSQHPALLEWPKLSKAHLQQPPAWNLHPPDPHCHTCSCGHSHLSPGDSEVSSIFRAAQPEPCPDCEGGREGDRAQEVYGLPAHPALLPHHHTHCKDASSSSESEGSCPCYCQQQKHLHHHHHHHHHHQQQQQQQQQHGKQYHSQPNIFTVTQQDPCCRPEKAEEQHQEKRCVSDSEGLHRKHGGVLKKSKQPEKKRPRDHSGGRSRKREAASPARVTNTSSPMDHRNRATPVAETRSEKKDTASAKHIPSKLQVKAIAEKSVQDSSPTQSTPTTSPTSPEPIYENMAVCVEEKNPPPAPSDQAPPYALQDKAAQDAAHTTHSISTTHSQGKEDSSGNSSILSTGKHKDCKDKKAPRKGSAETKTGGGHSGERQDAGEKQRRSGRGGEKGPGQGHRQEAWYMCSESEDSALPPETFSSSVEDGFTATDLDSDGSFELII